MLIKNIRSERLFGDHHFLGNIEELDKINIVSNREQLYQLEITYAITMQKQVILKLCDWYVRTLSSFSDVVIIT